jgi:hypothetical protein
MAVMILISKAIQNDLAYHSISRCPSLLLFGFLNRDCFCRSRLFLEIETMSAGGRNQSQQREGLALQIIGHGASTIISIRKSQQIWFSELTDKTCCLRLIQSTEIANILEGWGGWPAPEVRIQQWQWDYSISAESGGEKSVPRTSQNKITLQ